MSSLRTPSGRLSPDDRYELAARAQNQQRLNYPRHLIVLGGLLVFISIVLLAIAWQIRSSAISSNTKKADDLVRIKQYIGDINALALAQKINPRQNEYDRIDDILSQFQRLASQSKLEHDIGLPIRPKTIPVGNARKLTYPYTVRDNSLEHLLDWVKISKEQIPGLEVSDLSIKPNTQDWTLTVTFTRYERKQ